MDKKEIRELLQRFGISEQVSDYYANLEIKDKNFAWLSAFRFVRPLNNSLESYKTEYSTSLIFTLSLITVPIIEFSSTINNKYRKFIF